MKAENKHFGVIGHPIGHTMSPFIHRELFRLAGQQADYRIFHILPEDLPQKEGSLLSFLDGYNVTIPYKQEIIPYLHRTEGKAKLYGSVNTVKNGTVKNGTEKIGYTSDPVGFLSALAGKNIPLRGNVVLLGAGGVSRVMACESALAGCNIVVAVREQSIGKGEQMVQSVRQTVPNAKISCCTLEQLKDSAERIDLLLNGTPVGMHPNVKEMPVSERVISRAGAVFDAIYNPGETALLQCARANGAITVGGMAMLVWQAAESQRIWEGNRFRTEDIMRLITETEREMQKLFD